MIVRRPDVDQREVLPQAELSLEEGMVGDNWRARGSHSTPDGSADPNTQLTLMNSRVIQALAQEQAFWPLAGDQLFVDLDLSDENLPAGQRIAIGEAILEITAKPHTGCAKFSDRFGSDAIHFVNSPEGRRKRRRGVNARVVQAGVVRLGDVVRKV
jgi:MOSC domain-containing protein YiiM